MRGKNRSLNVAALTRCTVHKAVGRFPPPFAARWAWPARAGSPYWHTSRYVRSALLKRELTRKALIPD